ncbi:MAG TPA: type II toxin-antitoxin system Phd/YefM family antitoxin [Candidatus Paceibacterota bacterium]|nr:type II toxin-antitoxin system Phd/YefM family antitoxin [Candidatus Paceibacterota bacterium]
MIDTKRTISISDARKRIFEIADEVQTPNKVYTLTADGKPKVVIMSIRDFEALEEDRELLNDPTLLKKIQSAEAEFKRGDYTTLNALKHELGYVSSSALNVAEKSKKVYGTRKKKQLGK